MKLSKLYDDFVAHTSLTDGIYKTVFVQINDVLSLIEDIEWKQLVYTMDGQEYVTDFKAQGTLPLYIVEMIQNLFERSYTFPDDTTVQLDLAYKGKNYSITSTNNQLDVPSEIGHLHHYSIFRYFALTEGVYDFFKEFDRIFRFVDNFKSDVHEMYVPLQKKFEKQLYTENVNVGDVSLSKISNIKVYIEKMKATRAVLLDELKELQKDKITLTSHKNVVLQSLNVKEGVDVEYTALKSEHDILRGTYDVDKAKWEKVLELLAEIEVGLAGLVEQKSQEFQDEIDFLLSKKDTISKDRDVLEKSLNSTKSLMDTTLDALNAITVRSEQTGMYTVADVQAIKDKLGDTEELYDHKYVELTTIENEIKQQTQKAGNDEVQLQVGGMPDSTSGLNSVDIVSHLSVPLQPAPVTVVLNYLRYYFSYYATRIASQLDSRYSDIDVPVLQALACKLTLTGYFGVYFSNMFSVIDFGDNRVGRVNVLEG